MKMIRAKEIKIKKQMKSFLLKVYENEFVLGFCNRMSLFITGCSNLIVFTSVQSDPSPQQQQGVPCPPPSDMADPMEIDDSLYR